MRARKRGRKLGGYRPGAKLTHKARIAGSAAVAAIAACAPSQRA